LIRKSSRAARVVTALMVLRKISARVIAALVV